MEKIKQKLCWLMMLVAFLATSQVTFAYDWTSGKTIYFDNTSTNWSKVRLRVGHGSYNSVYDMTKVNGTANLYKYQIPSWGGYDAFGVANNNGWSGSNNSIYKLCVGGDYNITGHTNYIKKSVTSDYTIIAGSSSGTGTGTDDKCATFYNTTDYTSKKTWTVTIIAPSNGTITVSYKDENNGSQLFSSGNKSVLPTCTITVTAAPNTGYKLKSLTLDGSAFTSGDTYNVRKDITISAEFEQDCTTPAAKDFTVSGLTGKTYNGSNQAPTITAASGMGTMTVKYDGTADTGKTNAGTYAITVAVEKGTTFCASTSDISLGNFVIDRASRTISITNTTTTFCQTATPTVTSTVSAGSGDGAVTYTKTGGTATASINPSTGVITCTAPGTVIVKASVAQGTNYSSAESTTKTFTFDASPSVGALSIGTGGRSICLGSSQDITVESYSGSLQWKQSTSAAGTYSNVTSGTGATSATYNTGNTTKTGNTYYKVEVSSGVCTPLLSDYTYISVKNVPTAAQYIMTNNEQTFGSVVAPTITPQAGAGTINKTTYTGTSGTSYGPSTTLPTAIGTYKVTVDVAKGTSYCATTGIELSNNFVIKSNCETPNPGVISGTTAICAGGNVSLTLSDYTTSNTSLLWYRNGASTGVTTPTYNENNVTSNVTYTVQVSRTDVADCSKSTDNYAIPVTQIPTITAQGDSRCGNGEVTLQATATPVGCTVNWYDAATGGTKQGTGLGKEVNVTVGNPVTLYAEAVTTDAAACKSADRASATATAKLVPTIASVTKTDDACGAGDITFTANGVTASSEIEWFENSVSVGTGGSKTFSGVPAGTSHTVTAKATLNGCVSAETSPVTGTRKATPSLTIGVTSSAITAGETDKTYGWEPATFTASSSTDGATVTGGITQTTEATVGKAGIIEGNKAKGHVGDAFTGSYTATGTNGCTTSDSKTVTVIKAEEDCNN